MAAFQILKNIPTPKTIRTLTPREPRYPFAQMEVGDSFFVPNKTKNTLTTYASEQGRALKRKFLTKLTYMVNVEGDWELADEGDDDAVMGILVKRTA